MRKEDFVHTMPSVRAVLSSRQHGSGKLPSEEDGSGKLIATVVIVLIIIGILPQFHWFQDLTGITGWIQALRTFFVH